ncbi:hypothetical protein VTK26DRAFT_5539 [Humicola hyalothermophila]
MSARWCVQTAKELASVERPKLLQASQQYLPSDAAERGEEDLSDVLVTRVAHDEADIPPVGKRHGPLDVGSAGGFDGVAHIVAQFARNGPGREGVAALVREEALHDGRGRIQATRACQQQQRQQQSPTPKDDAVRNGSKKGVKETQCVIGTVYPCLRAAPAASS